MTRDVEAVVAGHMVRRAVVVGPPLVALFWLTRGSDGAAGSLAGIAIVIGNFLLAGAILSVAARLSPAAYHAAALLGFLLRLALISVTMVAVAELADVDRLSMGITVVVAYLVLLSWEAVAMTRGSERDLEWIS
jgi:hypothetical protein